MLAPLVFVPVTLKGGPPCSSVLSAACGIPALGSDRHGICTECYRLNFAESQELRLHEPDPSVEALTPRQMQAMRRVAERWAQEDL